MNKDRRENPQRWSIAVSALIRLCHDVESALTCHASALLIWFDCLLVNYLECHLYEFNLNLTI